MIAILLRPVCLTILYTLIGYGVLKDCWPKPDQSRDKMTGSGRLNS